jgi:Ca2+-transporting ATPase
MQVVSSWYQLETSEVLRRLGSDRAQGLSLTTVSQRLNQYGLNELKEQDGKSIWRIVWQQLASTMVLVLIVAACISMALKDYEDAAAILVIVLFNTILGVRQEYQAERAISALKKLAVPIVKVRRNGHVQEISARKLVPGDVVLLETGNLVPADCRLLESANLRIQESALTGESEPVYKIVQAISVSRTSEGTTSEKLPLRTGQTSGIESLETALGDRRNMAFMGTIITYGHGVAVVTETGQQTELGRIACSIETAGEQTTRLQKRLDELGRWLAIAALSLVTVIFGLGLMRGESPKLMFLTAVSLAVAAIPEGLPAVVTIALALGAQRMLKQRVLIRKLPAVETLGSVTVICSDKTGTLTENQMTVTFLATAGHRIDLTTHLHTNGATVETQENPSPLLQEHHALALLLTGATLCNDALLEPDTNNPQLFHAIGDPTEGALLLSAARMGLLKANLDHAFPRLTEVPFDSDRKRMTTVHRHQTTAETIADLPHFNQPYLSFTKGAIASLLECSSQVWVDGQPQPLDHYWHRRILISNAHPVQVLIITCRIGQSQWRIYGESPDNPVIKVIYGESPDNPEF